MTFRIFCIVLFFLCFKGQAQNYAKVDKVIEQYPASFPSIDALAKRIGKDFVIKEEKVRAIYGWLAMNIDYDWHSNRMNNYDISEHRIFYFNAYDREFLLQRKKLRKLEKTLIARKATCSEYSNLFSELCRRLEIEARVISGYSKVNLDYIDTDDHYKNHAWNAVKIKDKWHLVDVTWGASTIGTHFERNYEYYFFTNPEEFILTHFPNNPVWQLQENSMTKALFFNKPLFYSNYFIDRFEIAHFQKGTVKVDKKKLNIYFNIIPKNKRISYALEGNNDPKPMRFKKAESGHYVSSIRYDKSENSNITIYANRLPILGFKIKQ